MENGVKDCADDYKRIEQEGHNYNLSDKAQELEVFGAFYDLNKRSNLCHLGLFVVFDTMIRASALDATLVLNTGFGTNLIRERDMGLIFGLPYALPRWFWG